MRGREEVDVLLGTTKKLRRLALLLGGVGMLGITVLPAHADQPPPELKMILAPGQGSSDVITFSADEGDKTVIKEAMPETSRTAAPVSSKGATTSSPKTAGQAAAELTPMTVLPAEATAESAEQRAALLAGKGRGRSLAYPNSFSMEVGYRWDSFFYNTAPANRVPNIISELQFDDLESMTLSANMRWSNSSHVYVRGGIDIGRTITGEVQDSDYNGDNRTLEFSRSYADCDGGALLDANIGVGYRFDIPFTEREGFMHLMPVIGFAFHSQELQMTDGVQVIPAYGPFDGLDSNYDAHWSGPFVGLDMELAFYQRHALMASVEYHYMNYEADADWNLRSGLAHPVSFEHDSNGDGFNASISYRYTPNPKWFWTVGYRYSKFEADAGDNIRHLASGEERIIRVNEAEWESHAVMVGLGYRF